MGSDSPLNWDNAAFELSETLGTLHDTMQVRLLPQYSKLLVNISSTQSLGLRLFEPVLLVQNPSLHLHRISLVACVIDRVRLGAFDVSLCVIEPAFVTDMEDRRQSMIGESGGEWRIRDKWVFWECAPGDVAGKTKPKGRRK